MDVIDAIKNRRSIRKYSSLIIPKENIDKLIEAARLSPSAANKQKYKFIIVDDEKTKNKLVPACGNQQFVGTASHIIVGVSEAWKWDKVDVSIAFEHIVLEAVELGLGTCWIGLFTEDDVKKILEIPADRAVVALLTVGYPDESPSPRSRKEKSEIITYNKY